MNNCALYHGDCLDVLKTIPTGSVDMILQDPPYNTTACKWEWDIMTKIDEFWSEWTRIIKPSGVIVMFGSEPFSSKLRLSNLKLYKYDWVWSKNTSARFIHAKNMPLKKHENILVFSNGSMGHKSLLGNKRMSYNPQDLIQKKTVYKRNKTNCVNVIGVRPSHRKEFESEYTNYPTSIIETKNGSNNNFLHPTQKPVALLEYLIKTYTNEGETVFDGFMGSGSTGVACKNLNRNFIGIELDKTYFDIAKNRIENHVVIKELI